MMRNTISAECASAHHFLADWARTTEGNPMPGRGVLKHTLRLVLAVGLLAAPVCGQELIEQRRGHAVRPRTVPVTAERVAQLMTPKGFAVDVFADGLGRPRMMAVGEDGTVYVTRRDAGDVLALRDADGDGKAEDVRTAIKLSRAHGIAIHGGRAWIATVREVFVADIQPDGSFGQPQRIIGNLPEGGRHPNRTLLIGPPPDNDRLFITVGSTCNCCMEDHPWSATILRANLDGSGVERFAEGLRNTLGFGWHPTTRELWGMDHGSDWLGDAFPPEELNRLEQGKHYGWPLMHGDNELTPLQDYPEGVDLDQWRARATPMTLGYEAHAAPLQMAFYDAEQFPAEYRGDAFVAMHGSWNRRPPVGYEVVRIDFDEQGQPQRFEGFLNGFLLLDSGEVFGRPAGVAVWTDGSLLVGDDENGVIYRVRYEGE